MSRCYCNQCENGGYFEPNYGSVEDSAEFASDVNEPAEFHPEFVGPSKLMISDGEMNDFIPF